MTRLSFTHLPLEADDDVAGRVAQALDGRPHVFSCLDANRIVNLPELLETADVPHLCVFQGALAETAGNLAPWLVQLRADDPLLAQLLTSQGPDKSNPFGFWEAEAGIFIHSDMSLAGLHQHLRRFLRVHAPDKRKFLFRFWEPAIAAAYFPGLEGRNALINRWFRSRDGGLVTRLIVPKPDPGASMLFTIDVQPVDTNGPQPTGVFALENQDFARFAAVQMEKDVVQITTRLTETFPDAVPGDAEMDAFVRTSMSRMMQFGFTQKSSLFTLLAWDLHYGPNFETRDPEGELLRVISETGAPNEKFERLKARMSVLGQ